MKAISMVAAGLGCLLLSGCEFYLNSKPGNKVPNAPLVFDFSEGALGFSPLFSDYPVGEEAFYQLSASLTSLPKALPEGTAWRFYGNNHSDDLIMALRGRIDGLPANRLLKVSLSLKLATNVERGCGGIGGAPGESVYVKLASSTDEPVNNITRGYYRLRTDVGHQSESGTEGRVVGNLTNGEPCEGNNVWTSKTVTTTFETATDSDGGLWVMALTDSGFEGISEVYFQQLTVSLSE